jgi:hypothetical protein
VYISGALPEEGRDMLGKWILVKKKEEPNDDATD